MFNLRDAQPLRYGLIIVIILSVGILSVSAQDDGSQDFCAEFIEHQQTALEICQNQAVGTGCIASPSVDVQLGDAILPVDAIGDVFSVLEFDSLTASPLAPDSGLWGITVFNIRADLSDDVDESVQLVVYGGVELTIPPVSEIPDGYTALMQAFNLRATHETACAGMPPGVFINVPEGQVANFLVNGLKVKADNQIFIGLPADNSYLSVSRYGASRGQIVWGEHDIELGDDVAVVLVPMSSITPQVMMTPGGAIPTVTESPEYATRNLDPIFVYVAIGLVEGTENQVFLQWEVQNAPDNIVEFVADGKSEWEIAPATNFYQVVEVAPGAKAINFVLRVNTALGYVYRGVDFPLPITQTV
nr:hypothetical protein [Anaerolineae bacterium]